MLLRFIHPPLTSNVWACSVCVCVESIGLDSVWYAACDEMSGETVQYLAIFREMIRVEFQDQIPQSLRERTGCFGKTWESERLKQPNGNRFSVGLCNFAVVTLVSMWLNDHIWTRKTRPINKSMQIDLKEEIHWNPVSKYHEDVIFFQFYHCNLKTFF